MKMTNNNSSSQSEIAYKTRDLFKIRDFRMLLSGQAISDFGDSMTHLAVLLLINELTGSTTAMASMAIAIALPRLIFGLLSGVYIDRLDRKKIMIISDLLRAIFVLGFIVVDSPEEIWILYVIGFIQGSVGTFFTPARSAILPSLIPRKGLLAANSISQTVMIISNLIGTGIAGVLIGILSGYQWIFLIDAITFMLSMLFILRIRYTFQQEKNLSDISPRLVINQLFEGLNIIGKSRPLVGSITAISISMLGIGAVSVLLIPLVVNELQISTAWFGLVETGQTAGYVISGILIAGLAARFKPTNLISVGLIGVAAGIALTSAAPNIWFVIISLFITTLFIPPISASAQTIAQTAVEDHLRGRTSAATSTFTTTANLISMAAAGILADRVGVRQVFLISSAMILLAAFVSIILFRGIKTFQLDKPETIESISD
ncbi:MAG: MFS transporter [Anaerolineaceae bacterium]|nr:MFS transporter [Anaerolineaceae bacterium]